ncbi:MAG: hypothetical protein QM692_00930 [Thermomicrobiales bacterium]
MIPLPGPDREAEETLEAESAVWAFLLALFIFKLATVVVIFWYMRTWESGLILGATLWYWFPPLLLLAAGPVLFYRRLRKVRARRDALRRSEWMLDEDQPLPTLEQPRRS